MRKLLLSLVVLSQLSSLVKAELIHQELTVRAPVKEDIKEDLDKAKLTNAPLSPENVTSFAASPFKLKSATAQVPVETRLRIKIEQPLSAKDSELGDEFKARVVEDFYLSGDFRKLIVPKDTWIRGTVSDVKKPRLLSRSGKLGVRLDTLVTPLGDYVPLDAELSFQKGVVNQQGLLDPQTNFGDKAIQPTEALLDSDAGKVISIATLGVPVVGTLMGGTVIALFSKGDSAELEKGQELQIILTQNTNVSL
jgi:hypothetical protein